MRTADHVLGMRIEEGAAGYGIYVMLLELLRDSETRSLVNNPKNLAFAMNEPDIEKVQRVIENYALFEIAPDGAFRSPWLNQQLEEYDAKKEQARAAGRKGAAARYGKPMADDEQPNNDPIATPCPPPSQPYGNKPNNIIPNEKKSTQSKLLQMSWGDMDGQGLFSLGRTMEPVVDPILENWCKDKQKELDAQRGRDKHNLACIFDVCVWYGLGQSMFTFLCKYTNLGKVGSPELVKLLAIVAQNKKDKFTPKYPAEYLLVKLLEQ